MIEASKKKWDKRLKKHTYSSFARIFDIALQLIKINTTMKKVFFGAIAGAAFLATSCSSSIMTNSKNSVPFPGMTVTRADYKLSKDVSSDIEVREWSTLGGYLKGAKVVGETKNQLREGIVSGYKLDPASKIAVYKLLDANPDFDYLTNIRVKREYIKKWKFFFTSYNTKVIVTAKGVTLKADK
jgi:hypothetical protein